MTPRFCQWKGVPTMCGPRGLPGDTNILYHNNGDGTFTDVSEKAGILKPGPRYSITAVSLRLRQRRMARYLRRR